MNGDLQREPARRGTGWVIGQVPLLAAAIVGPVVQRAVHPRDPWPGAISFVARAAGVVGLLGSLMVFRQAGRTLGRGLVPFPKPPDGAVLRQNGIYGRVRHPIYLGILLSVFSWALMWQSRFGLVLLLPIIAFFRAKSRYEERFLLSRFPEYDEYRRRTPAFIPHSLLP